MVGTLVPVRLDNSPIGKLIEVSLMLLHFSAAEQDDWGGDVRHGIT
jgi:hypothetical protein